MLIRSVLLLFKVIFVITVFFSFFCVFSAFWWIKMIINWNFQHHYHPLVRSIKFLCIIGWNSGGTHGEGRRWIGAEWGRVCGGVSPLQPSWASPAGAKKRILAFSEGHKTLIFVLIWQNLRGTICIIVPLLHILVGTCPLCPPMIYAHALHASSNCTALSVLLQAETVPFNIQYMHKWLSLPLLVLGLQCISSTKSKDVSVYGKIKCANGTTGYDIGSV